MRSKLSPTPVLLAAVTAGLLVWEPPVHAQQPKPGATSNSAEKPSRAITAGGFLKMQMLTSRSLRRTSTFLGVRSLKSRVQVAFVIDGTESMAEELSGLKANLESFAKGLQLHKQGDEHLRVELAVVIYRDVRAKSGSVSLPLSQFTGNVDDLSQALSKVEVETGAPYFHEQLDLGVHAALSQLNWAPREDADVTRWIILCGDAPPYPEQTEFRKYATDDLVDLATSKGVSVYALLSNSGFMNPELDNAKLKQTAEDARPESRAFMAKLASATAGQFLDMWDQERVGAWMSESLVVIKKVDPIEQREIDTFAQLNDKVNAGRKDLAVAILPHLPIENMDFDSAKPAVQVATAIRQKFGRIPGVKVAEPHEVMQAFQKVRQPEDSQEDLIKKLGTALNVDLLVWGEFKHDYDDVSLTSRMYQNTSKVIAEAKGASRDDDNDGVRDMALLVARKLREEAVTSLQKDNDAAQAVAILSAPDSDPSLQKQLNAPLSMDARAQRSVLTGLDLLERSLEFVKASGGPKSEETEDSQARPLLEEAVVELRTALLHESDNPFTHLLLSNCYFNLARYNDTSDELIKHFEHLREAYKYREHPAFKDDPMRLEIEAEYALLVKKDVRTAIGLYEEMAATSRDSKGKFALRAHWMLAGLHLGDWGVENFARDVVSTDKAREHMLHILAFWPKSSEAAFYYRCIQSTRGGYDMEVPVGDGRLAAVF